MAKSPEGVLRGLIHKFNSDIKLGINPNYTPQEMVGVLTEAFTRLTEKQTKARVNIKGWKGKSGISVIERPEYFEVRTFQKPDQDSLPKEIVRRIFKYEVNRVIFAINSFDKSEIETQEIAGRYCEIAEIRYNNENKPLFPEGSFDWQSFFADRQLHTNLNLVLRLLDYYKIILYRAGITRVLKKVAEIQIALKL